MTGHLVFLKGIITTNSTSLIFGDHDRNRGNYYLAELLHCNQRQANADCEV